MKDDSLHELEGILWDGVGVGEQLTDDKVNQSRHKHTKTCRFLPGFG
jgi:hypothetical protein